jgi:hypothetical protein
MAGTLFGLGLSQQISSSGSPLSGALLYVYQENSSTPVTTYADFSLSTEQTFPIEADSAGRLPQIWVEDGAYRARLTTSAGIEVFDEASVTAIGASVTSGGGGGGASVDATTIFQTGDPIWIPYAGTRTGWVRANGRTIGSGSSAATERANADTQDLYEYLWNNFSNTLCAVSGGRGANATADFNANKTIALLDMRGQGAFGLDDMGNSAASIISGGTTGGAAFLGVPNIQSEGSWTPAFAFGGATTGLTYTTQAGRYVRSDDLITVWGTIVLSNNGSASGAVTITGLPYAASTVSGLEFSGTVGNMQNFALGAEGLAIFAASAASVLQVYTAEGSSGDDYIVVNQNSNVTIADDASISFSATYRTDDTTTGSAVRLGSWFVKL